MNETTSSLADMNEVLLTELHHRFYNSLQVISSLAGGLARDGMCASNQRRAVDRLQSRIAVLGRLHRLLSEPHGTDLGRSCEVLCRTLASAFDREDALMRVVAPVGPVDAGVARGLLLLLSELVTNAMKHNSGDHPLQVSVEVSRSGECLDLVVTSSGHNRWGTAGGRPRVASELTERLGGVLTIAAGRKYVAHATLRARRDAILG